MAILAVGGAFAAGFYVLLEAMGLAKRGLSLREKVILPDMDNPLMRSFLPAARALGGAIHALLGGLRQPGAAVNLALDRLDRRLGGSGRPQGIDAREYVGYGALLAALSATAGALAYIWMMDDPMLPFWMYIFLGGLLGPMWWWSWLNRKRAQYRAAILRDLPFCLDLLTLSIEAGLDFTLAISRLVKKVGDTPLGREFTFMLREIQLGKTRGVALRDLSRRVDVPEAGSVVASLIQAEELGAGLGPVLRILANQQRERRSQRAEEHAMKAPVKILAPLVLLLFPAVMMMIAFPIVHAWWSGR